MFLIKWEKSNKRNKMIKRQKFCIKNPLKVKRKVIKQTFQTLFKNGLEKGNFMSQTL